MQRLNLAAAPGPRDAAAARRRGLSLAPVHRGVSVLRAGFRGSEPRETASVEGGGASRVERIALNEATFRRANEIVKEKASEAGADAAPFLCECGDDGCVARLELTLSQYDSVRSQPTWFAVVPGHEIVGPNIGRVVRSEGRYTIVEKLGEAADVVRERADDETRER